MIRLTDRPGAVSSQAKLWVLCCMLLCVVARGRIEGENNAQPAWCGRPLRRLSPSQRALDAARRRVLTYDAKHVTQAVTNRSTLVEANMIYRSLPDPLEALATITLHTHKSRHDITYFELGCGEGLGGNQPARLSCEKHLLNLHAIVQTQLRGQHRVDGVGRLKFDSTQARDT